MSTFLIKEKTKKSFDEKISKLARKTQDNIHASKKSFERFCPECYDGRNSEEIFNELKILKEKDQTEALRERKEIREERRPDLYAKTTNNQSILCFVN